MMVTCIGCQGVTFPGAFASNTAFIAPALAGAVLLLAVILAILLVSARRSAARIRNQLIAIEAEQATRTARWQATIESMPDGLMLLDAEMRLLEWNKHFPEFSGVPAELLQPGMHIEDILRAQAAAGEFGSVDAQQEARRRAEHIRLGKSSGTIERQRPNGQILELRRSSMAGGGFVTLYSDVTMRRKAEDQLRQAQKMEAIGHLTAGVSHDFNNLLTVINGNLGMAASALEANSPVRARVNIMLAQQGAERATALTQRLVAFSRRQNLEPQAVNPNRIVSDMTELARHSLGEVQLETVLAGGLWDAVADPSQLENALLNLAVNARDAMPGGGKITVETANAHLDEAYAAENQDVSPGQYVMIAVSDNGSGMSPDGIARAFEPFYTTKEIGKGSGLGLSQVFGFIKQSSGHVKIYSERGFGTTVKLYLPRHVPPPDQEATGAAPGLGGSAEPPKAKQGLGGSAEPHKAKQGLGGSAEPHKAKQGLGGSAEPHKAKQGLGGSAEPPRAKQGESLLVVEDDEDVLAYATAVLESLDYHVIGTRTPDLALSSLETNPGINMLLSDVMLPRMNGPELAAQALLRRPGLGVLLTTGYPTNAALHHERLDRRFKVLSKPFTILELARAVRLTLDG